MNYMRLFHLTHIRIFSQLSVWLCHLQLLFYRMERPEVFPRGPRKKFSPLSLYCLSQFFLSFTFLCFSQRTICRNIPFSKSVKFLQSIILSHRFLFVRFPSNKILFLGLHLLRLLLLGIASSGVFSGVLFLIL